MLVLLYYVARRLVDWPFGLAVRGIHENWPAWRRWGRRSTGGCSPCPPPRVRSPVRPARVSAQTNAIVGLDSLSFALSAEALVMLILGGAGRLSGALVGAVVFTLLHHTAASINPYHWLFVVGFMLMAVVLVSPAKAWGRAASPRGSCIMSLLLDIRDLDKRFGGLHVTRGVSFQLHAGDRLALIGPNGAGKTTLVNQVSGVLRSDAGEIWLRGENVTRLGQAQRVRLGLARTFQITTLAPQPGAAADRDGAVRARGLGGRAWRSVDAYPALNAEAQALLQRFGLRAHAATPTEDLAYGDQRLVEMALALALRPKVLLLDEPMAGVPRAMARGCSRRSIRCPATWPC